MYIDKLGLVRRSLIHRVKIMERNIEIQEYHARLSIHAGFTSDVSMVTFIHDRKDLQSVLLNLEKLNAVLAKAKTIMKTSPTEARKLMDEAIGYEKEASRILDWYVQRW